MERKLIIEALSKVMDPEIGMDIITLGLIYKVDIEDNNDVNITMTLTIPTCPLANMIINQAKENVESIPDIGKVNIDLVYEPRWNQTMVSEDNYQKLLDDE